MSDMITFCTTMLGNIADFLLMEPIIWILGFFLLIFAIKTFMLLIGR